MDLSVERLGAVLGSRPFEYHTQVESTNDLALAALRAGRPTGTVIIADEQTSGRGRLGRSWYSPPGSALMFSLLLRPPVAYLGRVNMLGALSVVELIEDLGATGAGLKWPNDILLNGRKVCGILSEAAWEGDILLGTALGIGLNVRVDFSGTPFADTAISLENIVGTVDRADLLARLLARITHWSSQFESNTLFEMWRARLTMFGKEVRVIQVGGDFVGVAEEVDEEGALLVRDSTGVRHRVVAGDIALG